MQGAVLRVGEKVHVALGRGFEDDVRRHFVGEVIAASEFAARVRGHAYVHDAASNEWERQPEPRERIVPLIDARCTIHILPEDSDLTLVAYRFLDDERRLVVTDGSFTLEVNEFGADR